jgi:hypothetical protein
MSIDRWDMPRPSAIKIAKPGTWGMLLIGFAAIGFALMYRHGRLQPK